MARLIFYAILPGMALGLRTGTGFRLPPPETGLALFLAAVAAGSFGAGRLARKNKIFLAGLLAIFVFFPSPGSVWPIACAGLAFGALYRLPVPSSFRTAFAAAFAIGFGAVGYFTAQLPLIAIHLATLTAAPGALALFFHSLKGGKKERLLITAVAGMALVLCTLAVNANDRAEPLRTIGGRPFRVRPLSQTRIELNDPFGRRYIFPADYERFAAAAPIIALQSTGKHTTVLAVGEMPSLLPHTLAQFPWIEKIEDAGQLRQQSSALPPNRYDLILVSEFPVHATPDNRRRWLSLLRDELLTPRGALVYPAEYGSQTASDHELPFFPELRIYFADGRRPLATETALERRFAELGGSPETIPAGITTMLSLRGEEPKIEQNFTWQLPHTARPFPWQCGIGLLAGWLVFRFWGGRYPGVEPAAAAVETGFLAGVAMWLIFQQAEGSWLHGECRFALLPLWVGIVVPVAMKYAKPLWSWVCLLLLAAAVTAAILGHLDEAIPILWGALIAAAFRLGNLQEQAPAIRIARFYLAGVLLTVPLQMGGVF